MRSRCGRSAYTLLADKAYKNVSSMFTEQSPRERFWETSDWFHAQALREQPQRAGLFDLNRYQNR